MRLRADVGEVDVVLADWWQEFSLASDAGREDLVAQLRDEQGKGQRRVRVPKPAAEPVSSQDLAPPQHDGGRDDTDEAREGGAPGESAGDAPRKRRRRRRKPSGEGAGGNQPPQGDGEA